MKTNIKKGDIVKITGEYFIGNEIDHSKNLQNKYGIVLSVVEYGKRAMFGEYYFFYVFAQNRIIGTYPEDIKLISKKK